MKRETVDRDALFAHIRGRLVSFQKAAGYSGSLWWANGIQENYTSADKAFLLRMPAVIVSGMLVWINSIDPFSRNKYALATAPLASEWGDYIGKLISKETLVKNGYHEEDGFYMINLVKYTPASFIEDTTLFYNIILNELKGKPFPSNKFGYLKQSFTKEIVMSIAKTLKQKYSWQINVLGRSSEPEEYRYIVNKYGEGKEQIAGLMDFSHFKLNIADPFIGYKCYIKRFDKNNVEENVDCSPETLMNTFEQQKKYLIPTRRESNKYRKIQAFIRDSENNDTLISEATVDYGEELFFDQAHKLIKEGRFWN